MEQEHKETHLTITSTTTSNASFIRSLKLQIGEDPDYDQVIERTRKEGFGDGTDNMKIVPVTFGKEHKAMLGHCKMILEDDRGRIAINPDRFDKLITSLRTAVDNDGTLDKEATSYNDIFDAFKLALKFYHFEEIRYSKLGILLALDMTTSICMSKPISMLMNEVGSGR